MIPKNMAQARAGADFACRPTCASASVSRTPLGITRRGLAAALQAAGSARATTINRVPKRVPNSANSNPRQPTLTTIRLTEPNQTENVRLRNRRSGVRIPSGALRSSPLLAAFRCKRKIFARPTEGGVAAPRRPSHWLSRCSWSHIGRICIRRSEVLNAPGSRSGEARLAATCNLVRTRNRATASLPWKVGVILTRRESRAIELILAWPCRMGSPAQ